MTETGDVAKERLLAAAIDYVAQNGVADLSLRRLAAAIGTSHRMLIYHFDSKEGLLVAIIRAVEERQREMLSSFDVDPALSPREVMWEMWRHLSDPALWPNERLFFEIYGQALQARATPSTSSTASWSHGSNRSPRCDARKARRGAVVDAQARLDLAVTRGVLMDLLATGDRVAADAAIEQYAALFEAWLEQNS